MGNKNVIILSIGTANPSVGNILSEALNVDQRLVSKILYCTPSVLFRQIDDELAQKAETLLSQLGLELKIQDTGEPLPPVPELFDIALYIENPENLPVINKQLSEFLGCSEQESFRLLLNDPSIVLGGVSMATAVALSKRIDAEVMVSNPQSDLYTLRINSNDSVLIKQIHKFLHKSSIPIDNNSTSIENLDYKTGQEIWKRFQQTNQIQLINQSFQRFEITLDSFDINNPKHKKILTEYVGMPEEILIEIAGNLPVILDESVSKALLSEKIEIYTKAGLQYSFRPIAIQKYFIIIDKINDIKKTTEIIKQFFPDAAAPKQGTKWVSPKPMQHLITRYIVRQLEDVGCAVETETTNDYGSN